MRLGSTPGISEKPASQVVFPFGGFCPLVMSSLGSLSPRWKGAAADWCQPEKPLVNGPSRNPGGWQWLSRRSPEQRVIPVDRVGLTQDGMLPSPPHEEVLGTAAGVLMAPTGDVQPRGRPGHRWPGAETTWSPSPSPLTPTVKGLWQRSLCFTNGSLYNPFRLQSTLTLLGIRPDGRPWASPS